MNGVCIYCNHCQLCPPKIHIGAVNKHFDFAKSGDKLAKDHYFKLTRYVSDCIGCGEWCCPFHVNVRERMKQAIRLFGK